MSATESPYTPADRERWRKLILKKGGEVSAKLEEILNNKDATLDDFSLWGDGEPGETKERRLRRFFDHLMKRLRVVDHPRFGFDAESSDFLPVAALDDTPWLDCEPS
jgi:hypothetical protein